MAPYCAIPRDYLSDTPLLRAMGFWCLNMTNWVRYPLPLSLRISPLESMRSGGAIPPLKRGISAILARYPMKTRRTGAIPPSAILSRRGIARYGGGISHWAAKGRNFMRYVVCGQNLLANGNVRLWCTHFLTLKPQGHIKGSGDLDP